MADRLISADALDNALTRLRFNADGELAHWGDRKDWCLHGNEIEKLIADAPTVDAEKHGRWEKPQRHGAISYDEYAYAECSCCHKAQYLARGMNYCPNCGAKMDEVKDADT